MRKMHRDPVCGMQVDEETAAGQCEYEGKTYYFCALGCKRAFEMSPDKHIKVEVKHEYHHNQ